MVEGFLILLENKIWYWNLDMEQKEKLKKRRNILSGCGNLKYFSLSNLGQDYCSHDLAFNSLHVYLKHVVSDCGNKSLRPSYELPG